MYEIIVIVLMLAFNALLAAYEMGIASITRAQIQLLKEKKVRGASEALYMKTRIEGSLATVQLGITLAGSIAAATGGAEVEERFAPFLRNAWGISEGLSELLALVLFIVPLSLVIITFGELVPKVAALNNREYVVTTLSPFMRMLGVAFSPAVVLIERIVKTVTAIGAGKLGGGRLQPEKTESLQELRAAAALARASRLLGTREERIVLSAAQLTSRPVREIAVPAGDIVTLYAGSTMAEALVKAHLDMHTRFPVTERENDPQSIIGYANFKDIIAAMKTGGPGPTVRSITRPIERTEADTSLSQLLEAMIRERVHISLVVSGAAVIGMVALEDIIEELVGDIEDEYDYIPSHIQTYGPAWIVGGGVSMNVLADAVGVEWKPAPGEDVPTLERWCTRKLGRRPRGGEVIEADGLRVLPRKFRRKLMSEAVVERVPAGRNGSPP